MRNGTRAASSLGRADRDPRVVPMFQGYNDALAGRPYDYRWDDRDHDEGAAYQNGRMVVIEARRAGIRLPVWRSPSRVPPTLLDLRKRLALDARVRDEAPSFALSGTHRALRPPHLVDADLAAALKAAGLGALSPEPRTEVF